MDFDQNNSLSGPGPQEGPEELRPEAVQPIPAGPDMTRPQVNKLKKRSGWRIFWGIILALSILANIVLFLMVIAMGTFFVIGQEGVFTEEVIRDGPRTTKIAVVRLQGIIDDDQARDVYRQLKRARQDDRVKGIILRVNSPGGTVSGSDRIYNEIQHKTDKPVVAFMQGVAASGGYYASVACDKIVAEPTTITGSVGVIAGYMVLQEFLEEKLGIQPVIVKSGKKKDWPSSFRVPSEEEKQYVYEKLITPAYERFLAVVAEGRQSVLTLDDIRPLADGSIYGAKEAQDEKLIDKIGYLDDAIDQVKSLAEIEKAQVVEYRKPFSFTDLLEAQGRSIPKIDKRTLFELRTPELLYLWTMWD
ncbi:MAG TPA: signal peptide peptidase SppA [Sedimentisphaerales bacterium]|nr:signal peptide peptidase SppA [Sedimentisphaerales bacterium]